MKTQNTASRSHQQSGAHSLSGNVCDYDREASVAKRNVIMPIAADLAARQTHAFNGETGYDRAGLRKKSELNRTRFVQFAGHSLFFATLAVEHPRVFDGGGDVASEGLEETNAFGREAVDLGLLNVKNADQVSANIERNVYLGPGIGFTGDVKRHFTDIVRVKRFTCRRGMTAHSVTFADSETSPF